MIRKIIQSIFVAFGIFAFLANAQQAPAPNPMDDIPEKMPFDIPYGMPISLEKADQLVDAVMAESKKRNWKMNIAVVDPSGTLISFKRMDGAQIASVAIAEHKARVAARYRRESKLFENAVNVAKLNYVVTLDDVIASRGGIPLVENGKLIGAIGCSGGTGSQDEFVCKVGAAIINK
jgi:glc operon protein GlcG